MRPCLITALVASCVAAPLAAQGSLSLQGFGYPTGQISARAAGTASALAETDPSSPINPGALPAGGRSVFSFQIDPEFRHVIVGGRGVSTKTVRFPVITFGAKAGTRGFIAASFATLLDRTWDASYSDTVQVGVDHVPSTVSTSVRGAINDARIAYAWTFSERLQVGVAFHAFTGGNRMRLERLFADSTTFGTLSQFTNLSYAGSAVSAGVVSRVLEHWYAAGSLRLGGTMRTRLDDSLATHANAPNRFGASLTYDGIPGSQLAVRVAHEQWSRMQSLGTAALNARDVTELAVGADIAGPKFQGAVTQVRLGARSRDLPFGWNGHAVSEQTLAFGAGSTFARGWASFDVSLQRSARKGGGLRETGTILSVGLTVRP